MKLSGIIVGFLEGHMKMQVEMMAARVGRMATSATKHGIHIPVFFVVTKANPQELEKRIKQVIQEHDIQFLLAYNYMTISSAKCEVEDFCNLMLNRYGIKVMFYKSK